MLVDKDAEKLTVHRFKLNGEVGGVPEKVARALAEMTELPLVYGRQPGWGDAWRMAVERAGRILANASRKRLTRRRR